MTNVALISLEYFRQNTPANYNIDDDILQPIILMAGDRYVLPVLGTNLYNKIRNDITGNTLSGNYQSLLEIYVQPFLKEYVMYEALPFIAFRLTNKNVAKKSSDTSEPADLEEINFLSRRIFDNAGYFAERCTRYLRANEGSFPEYYDTSGGSDTLAPRPTQYFSGIHIPGVLPSQFSNMGDFLVWSNWINNL